jgi:hypothetical protein
MKARSFPTFDLDVISALILDFFRFNTGRELDTYDHEQATGRQQIFSYIIPRMCRQFFALYPDECTWGIDNSLWYYQFVRKAWLQNPSNN